jgi:flagellar biosynthesis/type III secretory pathway chaperone
MNNEKFAAFDTLTLKGIEILRTLNDSLALELVALTNRELENIVEFAKQKSQLLADFSENTHLRVSLLEALSLDSNKSSITAFLESCPDEMLKNTYLSNWITLEQTLQSTIDSNSVNEQVLKRNQKNIDTILTILQGKQANNILYDAKGDKGDYAGQSRIGKA